MIITCPECSTRYRVADNSIGADGRTVKCARCGHRWHQDASAPEPAPAAPEPAPAEAAPAPEPTAEPVAAAAAEPAVVDSAPEPAEPATAPPEAPADAAAAPARPRQRPRGKPPAKPAAKRKRAGGGWMVLGLVLVLLFGGGYLFRAEVVQFWPPARKLYRTVGLEVPQVDIGLEIRNVNSSREIQGGTRFVVITGEVWNAADAIKDVPQVLILLGDDSGNQVYRTTVTTSASRLQPGESVGFTTRLSDVPDSASQLLVDFHIEG